MSDRKSTSVVLPVVVALVLLGAYVGGYYWMVFPGFEGEPSYWTGETVDGGRARIYQESPFWGRFFAPIHWLDRRIRAHVWEPKR